MIYFLYGEDSFRSKRKLEEIIQGYKKVHKSGLNLIYINAKEKDFNDFYANFKINSMFAEKKLIIIKNIFGNLKFQEDFLSAMGGPALGGENIIVVFEDENPDQRTKLFKALQKTAKCQEFSCLAPAMLKKWAREEFQKNKAQPSEEALCQLVNFVKSDLWRMSNEIEKLSNYKNGGVVEKKDVDVLIKADIENDIFKTIDAIAQKNKKQALNLLQEHLDGGEVPLRLLSMIAYQFRNLLIVRELAESGIPYQAIAKKSGLHPFVAQKTYYACNKFSLEQLKKIYQKIFQIDLDIKTGKIDPELSLDLLISGI